MIRFEITITEEDIEFSAEGESILLREAREALEAQALEGLDREGQPLVGKDGQRLDLHASGRLWQNVTEAPAEGGLIFGEPYAGPVLTKYKADALNEASLAELERRLTPQLNQHVTNKEVK